MKSRDSMLDQDISLMQAKQGWMDALQDHSMLLEEANIKQDYGNGLQIWGQNKQLHNQLAQM
uniref:Uncharacterized protein n=1 Tax=Manihot esculenta TaxID=3983 RepID=A0A2C9UNP5_MANES